MSPHIFTFEHITEEGLEETLELPGKMAVCPRCDGAGCHLHPAIGEHAYSAEEFYESFPEPEDREEYFRRGGMYDVQCERCEGRNVVMIVDEKACRSLEQKHVLRLYHAMLREESAFRAEQEAERRFGC